MSFPFWLKRPWLLWSGAWTDRDRPDLIRLGKMRDPQRFVWAMLPHAARSFAPSILCLPAPLARAVAVANLYCRALDTLEDQIAEAEPSIEAMLAFARRAPLGDGPPIAVDEDGWLPSADPRDAAHRLLVDRIELVDQAFGRLPQACREATVHLIREMAQGMVVARQQRAAAGGGWPDLGALDDYCDAVIGAPLRFCVAVMGEEESDARQDALDAAREVGIFVQLANVTRDLEKDWERGVVWHPRLSGLDRGSAPQGEVAAGLRAAKAELLARALDHAPAFRRYLGGLPLGQWSRIRLAGVLMLAFTENYYQRATSRILGRAHRGWAGLLWRLVPILPVCWSPAAGRKRIDRMLARLVHCRNELTDAEPRAAAERS